MLRVNDDVNDIRGYKKRISENCKNLTNNTEIANIASLRGGECVDFVSVIDKYKYLHYYKYINTTHLHIYMYMCV